MLTALNLSSDGIRTYQNALTDVLVASLNGNWEDKNIGLSSSTVST